MNCDEKQKDYECKVENHVQVIKNIHNEVLLTSVLQPWVESVPEAHYLQRVFAISNSNLIGKQYLYFSLFPFFVPIKENEHPYFVWLREYKPNSNIIETVNECKWMFLMMF
jgi:hypothetical protein